jgi:uncharacterized protein YfaS (alpha-2-macroglobulin family)
LGISVKLGYGRHRTREKGLKTKVFLVFSVFSAFSVSKKVLITEIPKDRKASVETALTADLPDGFLFNWVDDSTLSVTPKTALPADGRINFTLATSAKAASGLALLAPLTFSYHIVGPLRVAQVLPADQAKDVSPDSAVVVTFNQPVVALGADATGLPAGLSLAPSAPGKGEWLNTSTYVFHPDPELAGGSDYVARVNPQLVSTSGAALAANDQNEAWAFHTSTPALQAITPKDTDGALALDPAFQLTFNQPMDRASTEANFALSGPGGKVPGALSWNDKSSVLTFKPAALLQRATTYTLMLNGQSRSRGGATLGKDTSSTYETVSPFAVSSTSFPSGGTRPMNKFPKFNFTAPFGVYKPGELDGLVTVSPAPPYSFSNAPSPTSLETDGQFSPGQTYMITISGSLKDQWGQALGKDYVFTFHEQDAQPSVSFGSYLPALFVRPEQAVINVQAVNVHTLNISRGTFTLGDYLRYQSDYNFTKTYAPADLQTRTENIDSTVNLNAPYPVNFSSDKTPLAPGLYYIDVTSNEVSPSAKAAVSNTHALLVSNLNVTVKTSEKQTLVWAVDLRTQAPVPNQALTVFDEKGKQVASGTTDANGLWQGPPSSTAAYVMLGQPGDDLFGLGTVLWHEQIAPWDFGLQVGGATNNKDIYLYTDRPVYRPGDTVHYRGVIRKAYDGRYGDAGIPSFASILYGPTAQIADEKVDVSTYGTFNGEFNLPASAVPGSYNVTIKQNEQDTTDYGTSIYFQVADYRKPEINLAVALSPSPAQNGQALTGKVAAAYFFGAPANDLPFHWTLSKRTAYFSIPQFETGLYQNDWAGPVGIYGQTIAEGDARTAADGTFSLTLDKASVDDTTDLTLEVTASESGGFPVSARDTVTVHPANFYAGIRPSAWFSPAGSALGFDLLSVDWDQNPVPGKALTASFQKVDWTRNDTYFSYSFTPTYTLVDSKQVTTGADGMAHVAFTPAQAGTYMLEVSGDGAKSQVLVWVGGAQNAAWPNLPYGHVVLTADKKNYKPGDTAGVFIPNPFGVPAPALITTERSSILSSQVVSVPAEGYTFKLPLSDDQAPNVYVSTTLLGPNNDFRQGYLDLAVEPSAFKLNVDLKATPEKAKPGDKLTLDLKVTDSKGQPVQGQFSMAVVDLAALALADPNSEEIVPAFYDIQPLGVSTGLTDVVAASRLLPQPAGGKGGGGGEGTLTIRSKFPDTAYWKADIVTDAQGLAQVTLTLPGSLTTWQVDSIGLTPDTKVGQARVKVVTSKDLLVRPQTPAFLVVGDIAQLAAMVNNTTSSALDATVSLQASGFSLTDPATAAQKVNIPANGRVRVAWTGLVQAGDAVDAVFTATAGSLQDASRPDDGPIPVLRYTAPQTFNTAGLLTDAATHQEILALPKTFQALGGKLDLELSPSLAAVVLSSLDAAKAHPDDINWSNELIVSEFLPDLVTYQTLKDAGLSNPDLEVKLKSSISDDVSRLLASQTYNNHCWSWLADPALGYQCDPYLTAYTLFALNLAGKSDLNIDVKDALQQGHDYLVTAPPMDGASDLSVDWMADRAVFQNFVLQQLGGANAQYVDPAYVHRDKLDPWAKALLAETLLSISPTDPRATELLSGLQTGAIRSATGAHWENTSTDGHNPGSPLFNTAVVVYSLTQQGATSDQVNPVLTDAVRYLVSQRGASGRLGSPYEAAWVALALDQTMKTTGELQGSFNFSAALNGAAFAHGQAGGAQNMNTVTASAALTQLNLTGANSLLVSREAGAGRLYYRAALSVDRPVETAPALDQGIAVSRKFLSCTGTNCQTVNSYQMKPDASGRVSVQLTVTLAHDAYYLMVQDFIPAGADILDSSLKTSEQAQPSVDVTTPTPTSEPQFDNADPFSEGWGWWYFNDPQIYSDHILWSANYVPAGTYLLTYTIVPSLPGQYHVLPAHAWQAYFPEVQGTSAGTVFEIMEAK